MPNDISSFRFFTSSFLFTLTFFASIVILYYDERIDVRLFLSPDKQRIIFIQREVIAMKKANWLGVVTGFKNADNEAYQTNDSI